MTKILVSDKISKDGLKILEADGQFQVDFKPDISPEELAQVIGDYDALVVRSRTKATSDILHNARKLRVIGRAGVGLDNVDVETATQLGIIVMNTPGGNTISTAELTLSMIFALCRDIPRAHLSMAEGRWDKKQFVGTELYNKVLGIVGLGRIGREIAVRARAFGMHILYYDPYVSPDVVKGLGAKNVTVEELVKEADIITVHTPLTDETRGLIGEKEFNLMKPGVRIINCARGGIIDEQALVKALEEGKVAGAAFDVFEQEPLAADHPLRKMPNVILTPHIGASTMEAQENVAVQVAHQIVNCLQGKVIQNAVNAPSIEPEILERMHPYLELAECLGKFQGQFSERRVVRITTKYSGLVLDYPVSHFTTAVIKGFFEPISDVPINYVNAPAKAREHGIKVEETKISAYYQYTNLITVETEQEDGTINSVSGTLFTPTTPRIVIVNDKHFDAYPRGNMIVIENRDVPGIIGNVGTLLGKHNINIAQLTWGRTDQKEEAMTVINVDQEVSPEILQEIGKLPNIMSARLIKI